MKSHVQPFTNGSTQMISHVKSFSKQEYMDGYHMPSPFTNRSAQMTSHIKAFHQQEHREDIGCSILPPIGAPQKISYVQLFHQWEYKNAIMWIGNRSPGWARVPLSSFVLKSESFFLIFPQSLLIFFLILALRVGDSGWASRPPGKALATRPTGYATDYVPNPSTNRSTKIISHVKSFHHQKCTDDIMCHILLPIGVCRSYHMSNPSANWHAGRTPHFHFFRQQEYTNTTCQIPLLIQK